MPQVHTECSVTTMARNTIENITWSSISEMKLVKLGCREYATLILQREEISKLAFKELQNCLVTDMMLAGGRIG